MKDLMIDLETLGCGTNCVVISIGAVFFDIKTGELGQQFYIALDTNEQIEKGRKVDASTIKWWMTQDEAAKKVFKEKFSPTYEALKSFVEWMAKTNINAYVWGNGSSFDISILENIFKHYGIQTPWKYNSAMDVRTFSRFIAGGAKIEKKGVAHNALDDAVAQAEHILKYYRSAI